ncbi:hypothetical protein L0Z66_07335 [Phaeobacter sp. BS34]
MLHIVDFELDYPERTEFLEEISEDLSLSRNQRRMFSRFFGFEAFHYDEQAPLAQMTSGAVDRLLARNPRSAAALSHVSHCHTLLKQSPIAMAKVLRSLRHLPNRGWRCSAPL